jgi:2-polyprenyl-6-methoxyphenol hydroxylase-like FAD-dependent oxidoreductase
MIDDNSTVLIAGAGIGGLTSLLTLHARNISAAAIERAPELRAAGVGVNLLPHAVRELHHLGLGDRLDEISVSPSRLEFYDANGGLLLREPLGLAGDYGFPQCSVHRGELQMLLLNAVTERLGPDAVNTGTALTDFDDSDDGVHVTTSRGDLSCAMLVGADGIHSAVRSKLHPAQHDPIRWSGVRLFRGATPAEPFLDGATMAIVKAGDGVELVLYRLGFGLINWVLLVPETHDGAPMAAPSWDEPVDHDTVTAHVRDWNLGWFDPVALIATTETVLQYPMVDRAPLSRWGRRRVTLLGDAAHPMYPVGANGASQTIVDAEVLAESLAEDNAEGLRNYELRRIPATAAVVAANRERHDSGRSQLAQAATRYRGRTGADTVMTKSPARAESG